MSFGERRRLRLWSEARQPSNDRSGRKDEPGSPRQILIRRTLFDVCREEGREGWVGERVGESEERGEVGER